jgi:hypothetical protein
MDYIDGGTGTDKLVVAGTDEDDSYVVTSKNIYGGGLTINYANIEDLQVDGQPGNDRITILSTSPTLSTTLFGNLGSDIFEICPREVEPVTSRNLRGHRGILEHEIRSDGDPAYEGLLTEGIAVDIHDNDGDFAFINMVENEAVHLLFEEDSAHSFTFTGKFSYFWFRQRTLSTSEAVKDHVTGRHCLLLPAITLNGCSSFFFAWQSTLPAPRIRM